MGFRQLTDLFHDRHHGDLFDFADLSIASQNGRGLNAHFAHRTAIGPGGTVAHPAILELQGDLHGITAVSRDYGVAIWIVERFIGQIMKTKPADDQK